MNLEGKQISLDHRSGDTTVSVVRGSAVPEMFWLKLQTEWGTNGRAPDAGISVPVSVFLSKLYWVPRYCKRYGISVDWKGSAKDLVLRHRENKTHLEIAFNSSSRADAKQIDIALNESRFIRVLRPFQQRDLAKLLGMANGANFSVPGAGKTTVAYAAYEHERITGRVQRLLVVSPISAFESWEQEAEICFKSPPKISRFAGKADAKAEILLTNYQRLEPGFSEIAAWTASRPTHMILDEAHRMKRGWAGEWGRNCLNLAHLAARRDILTGTPAPQSIFDLEALFDFVWPGQGRRIIPQGERTPTVVQDTSERIAPLFVRTTKTELALPEPVIRMLAKPLGPLHREIYSAILGRYRRALRASRRTRFDMRVFGRVVMYLLEAATNPSLLIAGSHSHDPIQFRHLPFEISDDAELGDLFRDYPDYETPWKFDALREIVKGNSGLGKKTLVWSNFVRNLETLFHHEAAEFSPAIVHGGVSDRENQLRRFRSDPNCHVLLANPAAIGEGISLHRDCHDAVYLERTFNAGHYLQSVDRIHRLGLSPTDQIYVTVLTSLDTIDEVVDQRVREKAERLGALLKDAGLSVMSLPTEVEEGLESGNNVGIDESDIDTVIRHLDQ